MASPPSTLESPKSPIKAVNRRASRALLASRTCRRESGGQMDFIVVGAWQHVLEV